MVRKTSQELAPLQHKSTPPGQYDIYPAFPVDSGTVLVGIDTLLIQLRQHRRIIIDGYIGVLWDDLRERLDKAFRQQNIPVSWFDIRKAQLPESEIDELIETFLGGDDPIFGTRFTGEMADFFDSNKLAAIQPTANDGLSIVYGCGAAMVNWGDAYLVYIDVPKNEIQFRSRAGSICNLGARQPENPKKMYKRFYFVDWIALNSHKASLLSQIDLLIDGQRPDDLTFIQGSALRQALTQMSQNYFRVRPWFEPGAWGGQWIKKHIPQLPQNVPNYAWSFELIVPENGLMVSSGGLLLEFSFDLLMYHNREAVVGKNAAKRFGDEFPVRFDFLDTFDGGNLSVQCHPHPDFIREHFGETYTQDETYYILDCESDARVYLGFQEGINPQEFRSTLERSFHENVEVDIEKYVRTFPASKHDLFLIPHGTIHCSGQNNLVLEISATPYIFTFKMYDWLRLDLDGSPRPLNIDRAFANLRFELQGKRVEQELISKPYVQSEGDDWQCVHVPTHADHFYDIRRFEIEPGGSVSVATQDSFQVMSLVEGQTVLLETEASVQHRFNYAETFVVPAAAQQFRLINDTNNPIKVINACMKEAMA